MWRLLTHVLCVVAVRASLKAGSSTVHVKGNHEMLLRTNENDQSHRFSTRLVAETEQETRHFKLLTPEEIRDQLKEWQNKFPDMAHLTTSQDAYGLPRAGDDSDCPFDSGDGCYNYILTIQDFVAHPKDSESSKRLPEVFWSGCLHGNERVGPTAVMEAASLLLEAASCEAKPRILKKTVDGHVGHSITNDETWDKEIAKAKKCRDDLRKKGIDDAHRRWLARLVTTRRIVIVPTSNALGYYRNRREEGRIDPNRDFPYDLTDSKLCMQTVAGRSLNEIFREHMFQLSLTFHGGMEVVAYEWGAPTYLEHFSPDDEAQVQIASAYSRYAGGWKGTKSYDVGTMNDLVYYVRGGMEDWAYAGSWDPERVIPCTPTTFGGYDKSKTIYNNSTLRVFNMLIETSDQKEPPKQMLGTTLDIMDADTAGNGHVSRNVRLALLAADIVEPYVSFLGANDLFLTDDVIPLGQREGRSCQHTKTIMIPGNIDEAVIYWTVGGGMTVDDTSVWHGKWDDLPDSSSINCLSQPKTEEVQVSLQKGTPMTPVNGTGMFSEAGSIPRGAPQEMGSIPTSGPVFAARIDVSKYKALDQIVVLASARVDQAWSDQPDNVAPKVPAQSHIVNARTNPKWKHESAGKIIEGRLDWYSIPLTIVIGDYKDSVGTQAGRQVGTFELSNRFGHTTGATRGGVTPKWSKPGSDSGIAWPHVVGLLIAFTIATVACVICMRYRRKVKHQRIVNELYEEEEQFAGVKPYSDDVVGEDEFDHNERGGDLELKEYV